MTLGAGDTVLCSGTLRPGISFRERVAAAGAGGFSGLSLWGRDYRVARDEGLDDQDIRLLLQDHGLSVGELDPAWWWLPGASDIHIPPAHDPEQLFGYAEPELFAVADAVGARSLNAVDVFGGPWSLDEAALAFAGLCDRAADHGLLVHSCAPSRARPSSGSSCATRRRHPRLIRSTPRCTNGCYRATASSPSPPCWPISGPPALRHRSGSRCSPTSFLP